jgi:hypothetical protein
VFIGGRRYIGAGDRWSLADDGAPGAATKPDNPTWILDALAAARPAARAGRDEVRGTACERHTFDAVDLRAAVRATNGAIALPSHGNVDHPTLSGDIWVDADGLVRRVAWMQPLRKRRRLRAPEVPTKLWRSTELWDFGVPVTIDVPDAQPRDDSGRIVRDLWKVGTALWHRRADYRRRHPAGRRD